MTHIWLHNPEQSPSWAITRLDGHCKVFCTCDPDTHEVKVCDTAANANMPATMILYAGPGHAVSWALCANPDTPVYVNGVRLLLGIHILRDRDEIRIGSAPSYYFSYESRSRIETFPAASRPTHCPRCQQVIKPGSAVVRCANPKCRLWHHQDAETELLCWTYSDTCAKCTQSTNLEAGYHWTPEGLWR